MGIQNKKRRNHYSAINYKKKEYNLDKIHIGCVSNMIYKTQIVFCLTILTQIINAFKTGMESGLICYQCVGTHPGCGLYDFDWRWQWGKSCPRHDDRCVKLIEKKGADIMVTRDCLSNLEAHRVDIPADKYEGCRPATKEVKLGQYTFNRIKELDTKRTHYDNTTWCFCNFDHWCNASSKIQVSLASLLTVVFWTLL